MSLHKKTVYIREEDLDLWAACPNKSLMIHNALQKMDVTEWKPVNRTRDGMYSTKLGTFSEPTEPHSTDPINVPIPALVPRFCKNGHPIPYPKEKCLGKGCKYA